MSGASILNYEFPKAKSQVGGRPHQVTPNAIPKKKESDLSFFESFWSSLSSNSSSNADAQYKQFGHLQSQHMKNALLGVKTPKA